MGYYVWILEGKCQPLINRTWARPGPWADAGQFLYSTNFKQKAERADSATVTSHELFEIVLEKLEHGLESHLLHTIRINPNPKRY